MRRGNQAGRQSTLGLIFVSVINVLQCFDLGQIKVITAMLDLGLQQ